MSERLRHLQRQQALLREHLAWIETELARETASSASAPALLSSPPAAPVIAKTAGAVNATPVTPLLQAGTDADALIERYAIEEINQRSDARRGCLMVFAAALALLIVGVLAAWFFHYRHLTLRSSPAQSVEKTATSLLLHLAKA